VRFDRPEIIRPPSEWASYYLPITSGCSNNSCSFCNSYGSKLQMRDVDATKSEIDALSLFVTKGIILPSVPKIVYAVANNWKGKGVFLQDSDALVYPYQKLVEVLKYLCEKLPSIKRVATYATAQDILGRSQQELECLKGLKLGIGYVGLESGDDAVLQKVGKRVNSSQIIEAVKKAKNAGILTSVTVILGLGGIDGSETHAVMTARALSEMDPDYVGALTLTLVPGTPFYKDWQSGSFSPVSPFQSLQELKTIIEHSDFSNCFFSSMHASNYFSVRGRLPVDKTRMTHELQIVLNRGDQSSLRPEHLRGL